MKKLIPFLLLLISSIAYAEPVARYDVATDDYIGCSSIGDSRIWLNDQNDIGTAKAGYIYIAAGCSSLPQVPAKYLKHVGGSIVEKSQAEKDAYDLAESQAVEVAYRASQKSNFDGASGVYLRALVKVLLDENNNLRQWLTSFKSEVAASSNMANFQTRVAGLPNMPDRTLDQAKTAIQTKIDDKSVDEP